MNFAEFGLGWADLKALTSSSDTGDR